MTEQTVSNIIIAFIAAVPMTLASAGALIVSLKGNKKVDTVDQKSDVIHDLVDGNLSKVQEALANTRTEAKESKEEIRALREMIVKMTEDKK